MLNGLVNQRRFDKVQHEMCGMKNIWLENDQDASLTIKSLKTYEDLIKLGTKSVESQLIMKHVNKHLWDNLHDAKPIVFNLPISKEMVSDSVPFMANNQNFEDQSRH